MYRPIPNVVPGVDVGRQFVPPGQTRNAKVGQLPRSCGSTEYCLERHYGRGDAWYRISDRGTYCTRIVSEVPHLMRSLLHPNPTLRNNEKGQFNKRCHGRGYFTIPYYENRTIPWFGSFSIAKGKQSRQSQTFRPQFAAGVPLS